MFLNHKEFKYTTNKILNYSRKMRKWYKQIIHKSKNANVHKYAIKLKSTIGQGKPI